MRKLLLIHRWKRFYWNSTFINPYSITLENSKNGNTLSNCFLVWKYSKLKKYPIFPFLGQNYAINNDVINIYGYISIYLNFYKLHITMVFCAKNEFCSLIPSRINQGEYVLPFPIPLPSNKKPVPIRGNIGPSVTPCSSRKLIVCGSNFTLKAQFPISILIYLTQKINIRTTFSLKNIYVHKIH